jgi:hypothetical protein
MYSGTDTQSTYRPMADEIALNLVPPIPDQVNRWKLDAEWSVQKILLVRVAHLVKANAF